MPDEEHAKGNDFELMWPVRNPLHANIDRRNVPAVACRNIHHASERFDMSFFTGGRGSVLLTVGQLNAENAACNTCAEPNVKRCSTGHTRTPLRGPPKKLILANFHYEWYPSACDRTVFL